MTLKYLPNGNLERGVVTLTWPEFLKEFAYNPTRQVLASGLKMASILLKKYGCREIYIDGSFSTTEPYPKDYDGCWNPDKVDIAGLIENHPAFLDIREPGVAQKKLYRGELYPTNTPSRKIGMTMLQFFQSDRDDNPKGIVHINLNTIL